ncbi:undecaprenyl-diphosphate phosphatase [Haloglomus litoreum]|uniref:undecaprenyl-diphosphate phosphatase n=1 Tax=Haloglomus litoreum TaxID=3034026 RepID=UPI0023E848F8|nr:undecaprenyl-diphosphate phosphatase [Haloglomus sp. DT116]
MREALRLAVVIGILQGVFEWLPVSSEGNVALYLTVVEGLPEGAAVQYALFLHAGTALAAAVYYRDELGTVLRTLPDWGPGMAFADHDHADVTFLLVATVASGVVGIAAYLALDAIVSAVAGGAFVALIGVLLVGTGVVQFAATRREAGAETDGGTATAGTVGGGGLDTAFGEREVANVPDGLLVGVLQGLAILPGVSRSGTTVSALLLRGFEEEVAFRLSFLLSIPAALGAAALVLLDTGVPTIGPLPAAIALVTSAVVGYATIDGLMRLVRRVAFWLVCLLLGALAIVGGVFVGVV